MSLSISRLYSKRAALLVVAFVAAYSILEVFKPLIGIRLYSISLVTIVIVVATLIWREVVRDIPEGTGASDEKTIPLKVAYKKAGEEVFRAVEDCGWKLIEATPGQGHFKCKTNRTIHTMYGQMFTIDVTKVDESSSNLHIRCEALHQLLDYGQNNAMIEKFMTELLNQ